MKTRKLRFNAVDALILLVLAAVVLVLLYVFVFSGRNTASAEVSYKDIQYVIEIQKVDARFSEKVKKGQPVEEAVERKKVGTVVGVQAVSADEITFDYENGKETVSTTENMVHLKVTIEAQAVETEQAFLVDGCAIRVGQQYSLIFPDLYGIGYCTELTGNE